MTISRLKYLQLAFFSKPRADRVLYRAIAKRHPRSIVELGLGLGERSVSMIHLAQRYQAASDFKYTGLDLFEARDHRSPGITLKRAYRMLGNLSGTVQLLPGDPCMSLAQKGNLLVKTDLVIVDLEESPEILKRLWAPLAKLVYEDSLVYVRQWQAARREHQFVLLGNDGLHQLANETADRLPRAA